MIELVPLGDIAPPAIEALLDGAFGPERHTRTAYRIRTGMIADPQLSFAAIDAGDLVGTIQCWPIALMDDDGLQHALTMVGPVAVRPDRQRDGIGQLLMRHMLAAADRAATTPLMLIGDPDYYGRFFGFAADRTAGWRTPGPVERHRLLARGDGVPEIGGMLGPRLAAVAPA
ncbi:MAG: GNAT family N-acetyltransferase [Sphingomonas sp. 28-66-16]|nr:MAG: GNAT family N-acetyltransferase [Sphingomonas sp. 28-66-16]